MKPLTKSREQIYFITLLTRLGRRDAQGYRPHQAQLILAESGGALLPSPL